jgi:hypothetical protein
VKALLLVACAALVGTPAATASRAVAPSVGVKFVIQYRGSFEGKWHNTVTKPASSNVYDCDGSDTSGTVTSSVRPGSTAFTVVVFREFGRDLHLDFGTQSTAPKGVVSTTTSGDGWELHYSGGECQRIPDPLLAGCGARTFAGAVGFSGLSGLDRTVESVYLDWAFEPPNASGCYWGDMWAADVGTPTEGTKAALDLRKLFHCGIRKPRGCRLTIGGSRSYAVDKSGSSPGGNERYTGSSHVSWSITFVAVGRHDS